MTVPVAVTLGHLEDTTKASDTESGKDTSATCVKGL